MYYVNERMLAYLGYTYEEFVADTKGLVMNGIHPDDLERVEQIASRAMDQDSEYEVKYRMKKKDGSYIWVSDVGKKGSGCERKCCLYQCDQGYFW